MTPSSTWYTPYEVTVCMNLTAAEIRESISNTFADATDDNVSLFYFSGHGVSSGNEEDYGALLGADNEDFVTPAQLRSILDKVPGRKIVIVDACCSGNLLSANSTASQRKASAGQVFTDAFLSAFSRRNRGLSAASYFVLTAAAADESSYEDMINGQTMGLFSYFFMKGCGCNPPYGAGSVMPADRNSNSVLNLEELYQYTRSQLLPQGQHVQVYPSSCSWFGILRK